MPIDCGADPDFRDMVRSSFGRQSEVEGGGNGFDAAAWSQLEEMGLALLSTPEQRGGSEASLAEAAELVYSLSGYGIEVPYGENDLLASWLTEASGLPAVEAPTSVALLPARVSTGQRVHVAGAAGIARLLVVSGGEGAWSVQDLSREAFAPAASDESTAARGGAVEVTADVAAAPLDAAVAREFRLRGALVRALQIAGSLDRCAQEATEYATVRQQFGRPLTRFQAVQALLAEAAAEATAAGAAVEAAVRLWLEAGEPTAEVERAVAVAKSFASHAVDPVTRNAHQVLGAMGTTLEHTLHRFTVPPLRWRHEFGSAGEWDARIASAGVSGGEGLWAGIVAA